MEEKTLVELLDALQKLHGKLFEQEERLKNLEKFLPAATFTYETIKELQSIVVREAVAEEVQQEELSKKISVFKDLKEINISVFVLSAGSFLGAILSLWYFFSQGLPSPLIQMLCALTGAVSFGVAAEYAKRHSSLWAPYAATASSALLWGTIFGSASYYSLISPLFAAALSVGAWIVSLAFSLRYTTSVPLALGTIGALLVPLALPGLSSLQALSGVLAAGIGAFAISFWKEWNYLQLLALGGLAGYGISYGNLSLHYMSIFSAIFFLVCSGIPYCSLLIRPQALSFFKIFLIASSTFVSFLLFHIHLYRHSVMQTGVLEFLHTGPSLELAKYLCFLFGTFYGVVAVMLYTFTSAPRALMSTTVALAVGFYTGVIGLHFTAKALIIALQSYALILFALSFVLHERYLRFFSFFVWVSSFFQLISHIIYQKEVALLFYHNTSTALGMTCGVLALTSWVAHRFKEQLSYQELFLPEILEAGAALVGFYWLNTALYVPYSAVACAFYGSMLIGGGYLYTRTLLLCLGVLSVAEGIYLLATYYWTAFSLQALPEFTWLFGAFSLAFLSLMLFFTRMVRIKQSSTELWALVWCRTALFISLFVWIRMYVIAGADYYSALHKVLDEKHLFYVLPTSFKQEVLACMLTLYYGASAALLIAFGILYSKPYIRYIGLIVLGCTFSKLVFVAWSVSHTLYKVVSFLLDHYQA